MKTIVFFFHHPNLIYDQHSLPDLFIIKVGRPDLSTNTSPHRFRGITHTSSIDASCIGTNLGPLMIQASLQISKSSLLRFLVGRWVGVELGWPLHRTELLISTFIK